MNQKRITDDVRTTMELLWRATNIEPDSTSPGPKPRHNVDQVVEAAIAVADARPHGGVSMRAVADRLGVTAMTLYGYVPGKDALVALMYDAIHVEMPDRRDDDRGWRRRVVVWANDLIDLYLRHPWAIRVSYARPVLGPHEQSVLESLVEILRDTGVEPGLTRRVIGTLFHVIRGTALTIAEARQLGKDTGISEQEAWQRSSTALAAVVPDFPDRFPNTMWLLARPDDMKGGAAEGFVDREAMVNFRVGLDVLLDGLEAAIPAS